MGASVFERVEISIDMKDRDFIFADRKRPRTAHIDISDLRYDDKLRQSTASALSATQSGTIHASQPLAAVPLPRRNKQKRLQRTAAFFIRIGAKECYGLVVVDEPEFVVPLVVVVVVEEDDPSAGCPVVTVVLLVVVFVAFQGCQTNRPIITIAMTAIIPKIRALLPPSSTTRVSLTTG